MSYAVLKCYLIHPDKDEDTVFAIDLASIDTLDDFLKELFDRVPELRTQKFSMDYQDDDFEAITIAGNSDFQVFLNERMFYKLRVYLEAGIKTVYVNSNDDIAPNVSDAPFHMVSAESKESISSSNRIVMCDGCHQKIEQNCYKCLDCLDFDLCAECERKAHKQHLMIRIGNLKDRDKCAKDGFAHSVPCFDQLCALVERLEGLLGQMEKTCAPVEANPVNSSDAGQCKDEQQI